MSSEPTISWGRRKRLNHKWASASLSGLGKELGHRCDPTSEEKTSDTSELFAHS